MFQEVTRGNKEGNHWYCLNLNIKAQRFEALDSMRGEGNESLINHASNLISRIKAIWQIHYSASKIQIENWDLKIINVPKQESKYVCLLPIYLFIAFLYNMLISCLLYCFCLTRNYLFPALIVVSTPCTMLRSGMDKMFQCWLKVMV